MSEALQPTQRFSERADAYGAFRPGYPLEAIGAVLEGLGDPNRLSVADIGAGTGISARAFAALGARVIAVEPNDAMRAAGAARAHPLVTWRDGTGEASGLAHASVDVAVAAQAFHWFDAPAALAEFRRIARWRGALLQYERDERDRFTAAYGACVRAFATDDTERLRERAIEAFRAVARARVRTQTFQATQALDLAGLLGRASSASYLPHEGPSARALQGELRAIFERFQHDGRVALAMQTFVVTADWERG